MENKVREEVLGVLKNNLWGRQKYMKIMHMNYIRVCNNFQGKFDVGEWCMRVKKQICKYMMMWG